MYVSRMTSRSFFRPSEHLYEPALVGVGNCRAGYARVYSASGGSGPLVGPRVVFVVVVVVAVDVFPASWLLLLLFCFVFPGWSCSDGPTPAVAAAVEAATLYSHSWHFSFRSFISSPPHWVKPGETAPQMNRPTTGRHFEGAVSTWANIFHNIIYNWNLKCKNSLSPSYMLCVEHMRPAGS